MAPLKMVAEGWTAPPEAVAAPRALMVCSAVLYPG